MEHKINKRLKKKIHHQPLSLLQQPFHMSTSNATTSNTNAASTSSIHNVTKSDETIKFVEFIVTILQSYEELKKKKKEEILSYIKELTGKHFNKKTRNDVLLKEFFDHCISCHYKDLENKPVRELRIIAKYQKDETKSKLFPSLFSEFNKKFTAYRAEKKISGESKEGLIETIRSFGRFCIDFAISKDIKYGVTTQGNVEPKLEHDKTSKGCKKRKASETGTNYLESSPKKMSMVIFPAQESKNAESDDDQEQLKNIDFENKFLSATKDREVLKTWQDNYTRIKNELFRCSNSQEQTIANLLTCTPEAIKNYSEKQCAALRDMIDMLNTLNEKAAITMSKFK